MHIDFCLIVQNFYSQYVTVMSFLEHRPRHMQFTATKRVVYYHTVCFTTIGPVMFLLLHLQHADDYGECDSELLCMEFADKILILLFYRGDIYNKETEAFTTNKH